VIPELWVVNSGVYTQYLELGVHEGGYTGYSFDITRRLQPTNYVAVEIDNRIGAATIPGLAQRGEDQAWYDWWDYGGIVRDVWLTLGGPVQVRRQQIRSQVVEDGAIIEDRIFLENDLAQKQHLSVHMTVRGPDNQTAGSKSRVVTAAFGVNDVTMALKIREPKLWGVDHPNVYRIQVQVTDPRGRVLDEHSDTFGVRKIEIRDRHLLINGERVRLTGVARHEESVSLGITRGLELTHHWKPGFPIQGDVTAVHRKHVAIG
jgi:beta-galactosidase/beta-glucuronidase